jgi:hypothetical protein
MNEHIKQLALQALKHPDNDNDGLTVFDNDELEKFAELIVQECANVAWDIAHQYNSDEINDVGYSILEHFGVEE